jgi:tetratricopeptide (TPR) repeat protein
VQLRTQTDGPEAGLETLDGILAGEGAGLPMLEVMRASLLFDLGQPDTAITELEAVIAALPEAEAQTTEAGQFRVVLARMLMATGNQVGARALVEEVLAADPSQVDALKMKASWLIEEDETREAISLLRRALDEDAEDAEALTLSARAHARNGDRDLAREFLALAVSASGGAPAETLRYADWLIADERFFPAEEALIDALRRQPGNLQLLSRLGNLYLRMEDWSRAEQVEQTLERQEGPGYEEAAVQLRVARLAAQNRVDDAVTLLENIASENDESAGAQLSVIQGRLAAGNEAGALEYARDLVERYPDALIWRFALATTQSAVGQYEEAIESYRLILEQLPQNERAWVDLVRALNATGDIEGAQAALEQALQAVPDGLNLLWAQASLRETTNDIEGAIEIYERLYERLPNAPIMANNLASLLSTYYDDDENLNRAYTIARRLRGIEFPPFQDTYGWIAYRRGDYEEALEHLEPAAAGLGDNALVQYHLGMTYLALERDAEALTQLRRAVTLAGPDDPRPQFERARTEIAALEAAAEADGADGGADGGAEAAPEDTPEEASDEATGGGTEP